MLKLPLLKVTLYHFITLIFLGPLTSYADNFSAKVVRVIDGDTVLVYDGTQKTKVRLYGIDAPESKQAFGQKSKNLMIQLAANQVVDIEDHGQDVYGRMLGTLFLNNQDLNAVMIYEGMAWAYRYQDRLTVTQYGALEQNARNSRKGLWADPHPIEPRLWRHKND
ncbi:thermonuclease family protein [Klebsiella grimontii]|uniref:thermonuclease family protein n=1 Tax=Klebsiella grimontii TaxID=2058152 RepID=UPI0012B86769|nr:thermonuclease family protein [Klebsiella grimontii]